MTFDPRDPSFFDPQAVEKELARVTEICDGCRRCHRLCPSFDSMLERVDANEGDVSKVSSGDYRRIVDLCWQCKLCFNHCPYTPPHRFDIDFPRLMLRAKAARAKHEGVTRQDAWLANTDKVGAVGSATAPLSNWANSFGPHRTLMEKTVGVHRGRNLPKFHHQTFARWFKEREARPPEGRRQTAFFYTCYVNYNEPQVGRDAVTVLEKNECAVSCVEEVCCGMPYLDAGDLDSATANARKNVAALLPFVEQGAPVVVPQPTCSYVLKKEYPVLLPGDAGAQKVASATRDLFEYLALRRSEMDGTWGMKKEYYPMSLEFARRAAREMEAAEPDAYMTKEEKMAAVHYVRFAVPPARLAALADAMPSVRLTVEHPRYQAEAAIPPALRAEMAKDLAAS